VTVVLAFVGVPAQAQFKPGNVLVSEPSQEICSRPGYPDRIWQVDPYTADVTLVVELTGDDCGYVTGLAVTPDGCGLRASSLLNDRILEFKADGTWTVVLDAKDGILSPWGSNGVAYDREGNFYVVNAGSRNIMRFPSGGGAGIVVADELDGVQGKGPLTIAPNGDIYYGNQRNDKYVLRIPPAGEASIFDDYGRLDLPFGIATDSRALLYVSLANAGLAEFVLGDPDSRRIVATREAMQGADALSFAADHTRLFAGSGFPRGLLEIALDDFEVRLLAEIPGGSNIGVGIAVVPVTTGDLNRDGQVDPLDWAVWTPCLSGPGSPAPHESCGLADVDGDWDLDLKDFAAFQQTFGARTQSCK
jgi:hypothetical protein